MNQYLKYLDIIANADSVINNFKSNDEYNAILEHVSHSQGQEYLDHIRKSEFFAKFGLSDSDIIRMTSENDRIGNPRLSSYDFGQCSPTSLRYIYHGILALEHIMKKDIKQVKIVEVGCGYGGLFLIIDRLSKMCNVKLEKYYLIDLEPAILLQEKYLSNFKIETEFTLHNASYSGSDLEDSDLYLISNYCLGEIGEELVNKYVIELFPKVSHGFLTWNTETIWDSITNIQNLHIEQEYPLTFWFNRYLRF
jgi:hypothetical protein